MPNNTLSGGKTITTPNGIAHVAPNGAIPMLLLSARDAAKALSLSEKTLWSITVPRGDMPCVRIGTRVLYDPEDIRRWIDRKKGGAA